MTDTPAAELGARIRAARLARNLTQDQLARAVGVTRSAVAQWETGRAGQIGSNLARIARVLETSATYLLSGEPQSAVASPSLLTDERTLLGAYRDCTQEDRELLLLTAVRLARRAGKPASASPAHPGHDLLT